ncbi:MAG: hypothetical protein B6D45_03085 [Ignavibacteriales bacterium UTCHB3]|nr:MAG: hypothetical protein B6D45_03085 [Ignavibacteriales bacterium UTCHB3]
MLQNQTLFLSLLLWLINIFQYFKIAVGRKNQNLFLFSSVQPILLTVHYFFYDWKNILPYIAIEKF